MSHLRALLVASSAALLLALTVGPASAATSVGTGGSTVSFSSDTSVVGPQTRSITGTVTITTGNKGLRASLNFESPSFTRYVAGRPVREGNTLRVGDIQSISGPMRLIGSGGSYGGGGDCDEGFRPAHGTANESALSVVQVPRKSTVVFTVRFEIVGDAPWINANYAPRLRVGPINYGYGPNRHTNRAKWSYFSKNTVLSAPRPTVALPLAARVDLDVSPRPKLNWWGLGPIAGGKKLTLTATLVPKRVGYPIKISINERYLPDTFLTDANGQVRYSYLPGAGSSELVRAEFPGMPGADLQPDTGCRTWIEISKKRKGSK